jgi:hypothetical protein
VSLVATGRSDNRSRDQTPAGSDFQNSLLKWLRAQCDEVVYEAALAYDALDVC